MCSSKNIAKLKGVFMNNTYLIMDQALSAYLLIQSVLDLFREDLSSLSP